MAVVTVPTVVPRSLVTRRRLPWIACATLALVGLVVSHEVPTWLDIDVQSRAKTFFNWTVQNRGHHGLFTYLLDPIAHSITWLVNGVLWILQSLRWPGVLALTATIGWRTGGWRAMAGGTIALVGLGLLGGWELGMITLSIMITAVGIALVIGVPLGIWSARNDRVERVLRPILDTAQVMPCFVYFIPLVVLFGIKYPPAVIAAAIFAIPPAVRLTSFGLRSVPVVANEVGESFGCTPTQQLLKVQLPLARRPILLGLNQVIMFAFGIVVLASLLGTGDLGNEVNKGLQKNDIGVAFTAGLGIVLMAIALDRISTGERLVTNRRSRWAMPNVDRRKAFMGALAVTVIVGVIAKLAGADLFPRGLVFDIAKPINSASNWVKNNLRRGVPVIGGTQSIADFTVTNILEPMRKFLVWLPWLVVVAGFSLVAWLSKGWRLAVVVALCLVGIATMGNAPVGGKGGTPFWDLAMDTLTQVLVAVVISVLIAVPIGIWAGRSNKLNTALRPFLDTAQVLPQFVYLIPVVFLFNVGRASGVIASVVYAVPPCIRLTSLGLREVPFTPREAAMSFGATPRQELTKVQLPLALRSILLGINQTILMVLATVVIAALIGGGALGLQAVNGFKKPQQQIGQGLAGGISIVLLAIVLDRITQAWGAPKDRQRAS